MTDARAGDPIPVVAAVITRQGRYLVGQRPQEKRHGGLWEFPGGKMEPGEDWLAAASRELDEELGITATGVGAVLLSVSDPGSAYVIHFVEVTAAGDPVPTEHAQVAWLDPVELAALPLAPADARFVSRLRQEG